MILVVKCGTGEVCVHEQISGVLGCRLIPNGVKVNQCGSLIGRFTVRAAPPLRVIRTWRARAESWHLSLSFVESSASGLQVKSFSVGCFLCFQAPGSDSEESKRVNVEEDVDRDRFTDDSGSD